MTFVEATDCLRACNLPGLGGYVPPASSGDPSLAPRRVDEAARPHSQTAGRPATLAVGRCAPPATTPAMRAGVTECATSAR